MGKAAPQNGNAHPQAKPAKVGVIEKRRNGGGQEASEVITPVNTPMPTPMPTPTQHLSQARKSWGDLQEERGWIEWRKGRVRKDGTFSRYPKRRYWYRENGAWKKSAPKRSKKYPIVHTEDDYVKQKQRIERAKRILEES